MEQVRRPRLDAEALDALEREDEADPLAGIDGVEVLGAADLCHLARVPRTARWNDAAIERASRSEPSGCTVTST